MQLDTFYAGLGEFKENLGNISYINNISNSQHFFDKSENEQISEPSTYDSDSDPMDEYIFMDIHK